jgi:hypothetical protein
VAAATTAQVGDIAATAGVPLHELRVETSSIEDVFFASIEDQGAVA